ncbi:putative RNA-directed DNA polymerase [Helianthus annuus]|nr:putative RNA-directed DNA polymerase [Helianthus annuus]KAJ0870249.1 putative RNA-directed DNA polymerase [Helianthus annuus]
MEYMSFPEKWIGWIKGCLRSGKGSVLVNGSPSKEFAYKRGLRQGDPLSPFLFILAMQVLDMFMRRAVSLGLFHGVKTPNGGPTISHLCYADDVLFVGEWSERNFVYLKHLLRCLFLVTGLKVNYNKSKIYGVGVGEAETQAMAEILNCGMGSLPFTYLGVPIGANMKRAVYWQPVVDKFHKKLSSWKANTLSFAGRVTLTKAVLGSLPSYYLSLFLAPKSIVKKLESIRRSFIWGRTNLKNKINWVRWEKLIRPKNFGGIGLGGIRDFNIAMLAKWWWRYKEEPNQLWASVIKAYHTTAHRDNLVPIKKSIPGVWKDIGSVDGILSKEGINISEKIKVTVGDGKNTRFWKDIWLTNLPLKFEFPDLFRLAKNKDAMVASNWQGSMKNPIWAWEWSEDPTTMNEWEHLAGLTRLLANTVLKDAKDQWQWENEDGVPFSVRAVRRELYKQGEDQSGGSDFYWNSWAPLKANYFLWRALMGKVATKNELRKRGVNIQEVICATCGFEEETIDHLFAKCLTARSIWWNVFSWLKIPWPPFLDSLKEILEVLQNSPGAKTWKRLVHMIAVATVWRIWIVRNNTVFEGEGISVRKAVDLIKEDSFIWISNRSKKPTPKWDQWIDFEVLCML